jgi:hypothetical protein
VRYSKAAKRKHKKQLLKEAGKKTGKSQTKLSTPMWIFGSQMGPEFINALVQVFWTLIQL